MKNIKCCLCERKTSARRRRCNSCNTKIRRIRTKNAAIEYLGGYCKRCGYNSHPAALEFHHLRDKDFTIADVANKSWDLVKKELDKCELLCSNCHRIEHSNRTEEKFMKEAAEYKGRILAL